MSLLVVKIQRSSFYDGHGIRTTVFLKGCSLRCPWCCNPECMLPSPQFYFDKERCLRTRNINCRECDRNCFLNMMKDPQDIIEVNRDSSLLSTCLNCRDCIKSCPTGAIGVYGEKFAIGELIELLKRDKNFYIASKGGVTFSGGEPLLQAKELVKYLRRLKKEGIHTCVETSLFCSPEYLDLVKEFVDLFIIDVKVLDPNECKKYLGEDLDTYLKNVRKVLRSWKSCTFRFPVVKLITFNESNIKLLCNFIEECEIKDLEVFDIHNFATKKYKTLGMRPPCFEKIRKEELELLRRKLSVSGTTIKILDI